MVVGQLQLRNPDEKVIIIQGSNHKTRLSAKQRSGVGP